MGTDTALDSEYCAQNDTMYVSEDAISLLLYTPVNTIIVTVIIPIILFLGAFTNLTFLVVVFCTPKRKSTTTLYLAHLALADLLYLSLSATFRIWKYASSPVTLLDPFVNAAQCISFATTMNTGYFASIMLVTMVSYERYVALCHPIKHHKIRSRRRTCKMISLCWLVGLIFGGLTVPTRAVLITSFSCLLWPDNDAYRDFPATITHCGPTHSWVKYYVHPLTDIPWLIAMVANVYMYVRITRAFKKSSEINSVENYRQNVAQIQTQVSKMLVLNGVVFFLCQTPYHVIDLSWWVCLVADIHNPFLEVTVGGTAWWIFILLLMINSSINPLIYGAMNSQYRTAFLQMFQYKRRVRKYSTNYLLEMGGAENRNTLEKESTIRRANESQL